MRHLSYQELRSLEGKPIELHAKRGPLGVVRNIIVAAGDVLRFTTRNLSVTGRVLEVNHGAQYPVKVEYPGHDNKRIVSFHPDEFISVIKES